MFRLYLLSCWSVVVGLVISRAYLVLANVFCVGWVATQPWICRCVGKLLGLVRATVKCDLPVVCAQCNHPAGWKPHWTGSRYFLCNPQGLPDRCDWHNSQRTHNRRLNVVRWAVRTESNGSRGPIVPILIPETHFQPVTIERLRWTNGVASVPGFRRDSPESRNITDGFSSFESETGVAAIAGSRHAQRM